MKPINSKMPLELQTWKSLKKRIWGQKDQSIRRCQWNQTANFVLLPSFVLLLILFLLGMKNSIHCRGCSFQNYVSPRQGLSSKFKFVSMIPLPKSAQRLLSVVWMLCFAGICFSNLPLSKGKIPRIVQNKRKTTLLRELKLKENKTYFNKMLNINESAGCIDLCGVWYI